MVVLSGHMTQLLLIGLIARDNFEFNTNKSPEIDMTTYSITGLILQSLMLDLGHMLSYSVNVALLHQ